MTTPGGGDRRIAIAGRFLDEVHIRMQRHEPGTISHLSFPAHRHEARVEPDRVTLTTPAATVVALFAQRILAPIGGTGVALTVGGVELGCWHLDAVEIADTAAQGNAIILSFARSAQPGS